MHKHPELNEAFTEMHRELIEQCRQGDRVAQYRLYGLYSKAMYNICLRMVPDEQESQDILQEAFLKAFGKLRSFRGECPFGVWLKRIVINQCLSYLRKKRPVLIDITSHEPIDNCEDPEPDEPIDPGTINDSILQLPDKARIIFTLFCLEGYHHKEIAELLGITESTSKTQYHRARLLLQEKIRDHQRCRV